MSVYRGEGVRLKKETSQNLINTCYPGADETVMGKYARMRPQLVYFHAFDKAHLVMLVEKGLVPAEDARKMFRVFREIEAEGVEEVRAATCEHMHSGEAILTAKLGKEIGGEVHLGRSSGDLLTVSYRMAMRERLLTLCDQFNRMRQAVLKLADENLETVIPGYTHMQHAQPQTLAHYMGFWASSFDRDFQRFRSYYERLNMSPAGAAVVVGSDFPLDRQRTCELLGFDRVNLNTLDSIYSRDVELEAHTILTIMTATLGRMCEDLLLWSSSEFAMVEIDDGLCGTSSIMPQKKNAYGVEYLKGLVGTCLGYLVESVTIYKNPPTATTFEWIRNLTDAWRSYDEVITALPLVTETLETLTVNRERMREQAGAFWDTATDLAGTIVRECGLPWRFGHQITGVVVRMAIEEGRKPAEVDSAFVDRAAQVILGKELHIREEAIGKAMDPWHSVLAHDMPGGPAPVRMEEELKIHHNKLEEDIAWTAKCRGSVKAAKLKLEQAIDEILAGSFQDCNG